MLIRIVWAAINRELLLNVLVVLHAGGCEADPDSVRQVPLVLRAFG